MCLHLTHIHTHLSTSSVSFFFFFFFFTLTPVYAAHLFCIHSIFLFCRSRASVWVMRGWARMRERACGCVLGIKEDTLSPTHVSTDECLWSAGLQEEVGALVPFCMYNVQIGICGCSVWSHSSACVYKHMPVWLCARVVINVQSNVGPQVILHCVFSLAD